MTTDEERRALPRKYLIIYSRVFEREMGRLLGYLGDLSMKGAMIISENPLEENSMLELRFDLPDGDRFGKHHLDIKVRVAHCQPDISPTFFNIGFEFLDISKDQSKIIEQMMEMYEFRRDGQNYPLSPSTLEEDQK